jgi:hypothetical protein
MIKLSSPSPNNLTANTNHSDNKTTNRILLIGSSGGGTATLGHTQSTVLIDALRQHFKEGITPGSGAGKIELTEYFWISMDNGQGLDSATGDDVVTLIHSRPPSQNVKDHGTLNEINHEIKDRHDGDMAQLVRTGQIDGIISVSSRPDLFPKTFVEVAKSKIPVTGTGGTSLSILASRFGVNLVGNAGGSVATTPETKAVSFCGSLAQAMGLTYDPWLVKKKKIGTMTATNDDDTSSTGRHHAVPSVTSVLNGCLPAFWAVMLFKRFVSTALPSIQTKVCYNDETLQCEQQQNRWMSMLFERLDVTELSQILESYALPIVCAVIMATSRRKTEGVVMAAILAGCTCKYSVLGGLVGGWLVAYGEELLLYQCILTFNLPATMTNLLTSGFVGICVAAVMKPISPLLALLTETYRRYAMDMVWTPSTHPHQESMRLLFVSFCGSIFCYGSKVGWCTSQYQCLTQAVCFIYQFSQTPVS